MPRRTKAEALETRHNILTAALEVFRRRGYAVATLEEIAAQAGVTRGAVYWHFDGKAGLYGALMEEVGSRSGTVIQGALTEGASLTEVLRLVFIRLLEAVEQDREFRSIIELGLRQTAGIPDLQDHRLRQIEAGEMLLAGIAETVRQAAEAGQVRPDLEPMDIARGFLALQNGLIQQWLVDPNAYSLSESGSSIIQIFLQGVLPLR